MLVYLLDGLAACKTPAAQDLCRLAMPPQLRGVPYAHRSLLIIIVALGMVSAIAFSSR